MHANHGGGGVPTTVPEITQRHGRRLNNPFPLSAARAVLPLLRGSLSVHHALLGTTADAGGFSDHSYPVGDDFVLTWFPASASFSLTHRSQRPDDDQAAAAIWSTVPGEAFLHAALVRTRAEECRGSFVVRDAEVVAACAHQEIDGIQVLYSADDILDPDRRGSGSGLDELLRALGPSGGSEPAEALTVGVRFPICLITGWVSAADTDDGWHGTCQTRRGYRRYGPGKAKSAPPPHRLLAARYWFLLDQKEATGHVGFRVKLGAIERQHPTMPEPPRSPPRRGFRLPHARRLRWKLALLRRRVPWVGSQGAAALHPITAGFTALRSEEDEYADQKVSPAGAVGGLAGSSFNRVYLTYASEADERFYGFGEQFSHLEFKGRKVPVLVQEQGIGRGDQPITFAANLVSYRAGGDWSTTYAPSPFYMTSKMRSLYLEGYDYSVFDLTKLDRVQIQIHNSSAQGRILYGTSPTQLIERYTEVIGRQPELPSWILSGAVVGMQGGTDAVLRVWKQLQEHGVPVSAFWLQDWVGQRETVIGSQLWWNWELDGTRYPGWDEMVKDMSARGIRVMGYCNPCLAPADTKPFTNRNLFEEARKLDILVKDRRGEVYRVANTAFDVGMIDFTHPDACPWFKKVLRDMVVGCGIRGWMADFGEGLPLDAVLYSGEDPVSAHNRYPELWAKVNREFTDEWKQQRRRQREQQEEHALGRGGEETTSDASAATEDGESDQLVFFMRAGFRDSPRWAPLFWEGDQMVSWQRHDGIKSSVAGLLSGGISGFALNHSDIGGYCTVPISLPLVGGGGGYRRTEELLLRWMEVNAFTTVFRTHEGNRPSSNCQFYSNATTLSHFARLAKVYKAWKFYRVQLVKEASQKGLPVCRHLFLHYPKDKRVHGLTYHQFLVGTDILVVPVLDKGGKRARCYFPLSDGASWLHVWTGKVFGWSSTASKGGGGDRFGFEDVVDAPVGYPAVFVKLGSDVGNTFLRNLRDLDVL